MVTSVLLSLLLLAPSQAAPASGADPAEVRVVLEDLGNVGLRISDAQALATDVMTGLQKRLGYNAVIFEGSLAGHLKMKRLLGGNAESQIQDDQIAYLKAAMEKARFRVGVRFGKTKKAHFVTLACRNSGAPKDAKPLEEVRFEGATFAEARKAMNAGLPEFCRIADPPAQGADQPKARPKKAWSLPPRRE